MSAENPYQSPASPTAQTDSLPDRIRISNINHAGVPLAIAFVIGPLFLAGLVWLFVSGRAGGNQGGAANPETIAVIVVVGIAELVACAYALRVPVLWIEIGPILRYATALGVHEVSWADLQRIWIDREDWEGHVAPFVSVTIVKHHVLVIQISDYKDLRVLLPESSKYLIERVMEQHPRFRQSAFDDEPSPRDAEDVNE